MPRYRHIILDRDGVLNRESEVDAPVTSEVWAWEEGSLEALRLFTQAGIRVSVATNQSWVGRGALTREAVDAVHRRLRSDAEQASARIAEIHVCPHTPFDGCTCRKPAPGLVLAAMEGSDIPAEATLFVGDALRDLLAGRAAGIDVALVRTGKGRQTEQSAEAAGVWVFDRLINLAEHVVNERPFPERVGGGR